MAHCLLIPSYLLLRTLKDHASNKKKKTNKQTISTCMEVIFTLGAGPNVETLLSKTGQQISKLSLSMAQHCF